MDTSTVATRTVLATSQLASGYRARRRAERVVVPPVDLTVTSGELVTLLGPTGAGKSTLLRTISGVQPAMSGGVTLLGDPLDGLGRAERARRLASVLTERVSVGQLAGYDLVALGRQPHTGWNGVLDERDHRVVADAIVAVGGAHLAERDIGELSDGERQRLMIARALAQAPAVLRSNRRHRQVVAVQQRTLRGICCEGLSLFRSNTIPTVPWRAGISVHAPVGNGLGGQ